MKTQIYAARFDMWSKNGPKKLFTGFKVGPFFIFSNTSDDGSKFFGQPGFWSVRNYKLMKNIKCDIPTHAMAIKYAEELVNLCSYDEDDDDDDYYDDNRSFLSRFFFG